MSSISPLGSRALPSLSSLLSGANPLTDSKSASASSTALPSQAKAAASGSPTSLSSSGIDLQQRVGSVGSATVDLAQSLMNSFAEKIFGSSGKGASIDFSSAALDTSSSYSSAALHTEGPDGSTDAAAFQLTDSSHFLGKGTITTADGRKFDFEVEIQYDAELDVGVSQSTGKLPLSAAPDAATADAADGSGDSGGGGGGGSSSGGLKTLQFPNIDFAGTLADLFKLIGHNLQSALATNDGSGDGSDSDSDSNSIDRNTLRNLSVRLLNLVDSKPADTYAAPTAQDSADQRAKALASAYGTAATLATPAAPDAAPANAETPAATT